RRRRRDRDLRRRGCRVRDRRGDQAPAAARPGRHRHHARGRGGDHRLRAGGRRRPWPRHHLPVSPEAEHREWDASTYDRVSDIQADWSLEVMDRLDLQGDETVLDAGCGSGRVTRLLLERLPDGRVIGVDASRSMIEKAREALPDRTEFIVSDLLDLELEQAVDAVFSNATFHWILDHRRLFERLHAALRPGGA